MSDPEDVIVYITYEDKFHFHPDYYCETLDQTKKIIECSLAYAQENGWDEPCDVCCSPD